MQWLILAEGKQMTTSVEVSFNVTTTGRHCDQETSKEPLLTHAEIEVIKTINLLTMQLMHLRGMTQEDRVAMFNHMQVVQNKVAVISTNRFKKG